VLLSWGALLSILVNRSLSALFVLVEQIIDGARQCRGRSIWVEWAGGYSKGKEMVQGRGNGVLMFLHSYCLLHVLRIIGR